LLWRSADEVIGSINEIDEKHIPVHGPEREIVR
jgi:hypothetical protein